MEDYPFSEKTRIIWKQFIRQFDGINRTKDENIRMYLDAFTGEVYYYTYGESVVVNCMIRVSYKGKRP